MFVELLLKKFNCDTVNYLCWDRIPNIYDSIEEKVLRYIRLLRVKFVRSVVTYSFMLILSKPRKILNSLRLDRLNKFSSFSRSS